MPVFIEEVQYVPEDATALTYTDYLAGNIFQKITLTVKFRVETYLIPTTKEPIVMADPLFKTPDWVTDNISNRFDDYNVDDEIIVVNTGTGNNNNYIISEKSGQSIRVTDTLGGVVTLTNATVTQGRIDLVQDPTGISYDFGLIENSEATNFLSKEDGSLMRFERGITTAPLTDGSITPIGKKDWQLGTATLRNTTTGSEKDTERRYRFEIDQVFYIRPFYLPSQIEDMIAANPRAPRYWRKDKAIKHVFRIRALRELQDPNVFQEGVYDEKDGQTGWTGEMYNGGTKRFYMSNLSYGNTIGTIDPNNTTAISFDINTNTDLNAIPPNYITLNFIVLPENEDDISNRDELLQNNYCFDRAKCIASVLTPIPVNGERHGTDYQVFDQIECIKSGTKATVTGNIILGAAVKSKLASYADSRFWIVANVAFGLEPADSIQYTSVWIDLNKVDIEIADGIIDVSTDLLYHDQNDNTTVVTTPEFKVEDEIVADSLILLDWDEFPNSQIDYLKPQIIAKKTGEDDVVLLESLFDMTGAKLAGDVRFISDDSASGFDVNANEIRYSIKAYRNSAQDTGAPEYAYRVQYPFIYRWEYWETLILNKIPSGWLDTAEPNNGINNEWLRIAALTGWDIYYNLQTKVSFSGKTKVINSSKLLTAKGYESAVVWDSPSVVSLDGVTGIDYNNDPYIMQNKQTTIKFNVDYVGVDIIDETDVYMVARLIPKENGTFKANESLSSVYDRTFSGGLFIGDTNGKIVITEDAGVFTGTFDIDHNNLPFGILNYTLSISVNRNSTTGLTDYGDVFKQDLLVLKVLEPPKVIPQDENPFKNCCYPLQVFADLASDNEFKNDWDKPIKIIPLQYTCTMYLEKLVEGVWVSQATLNDNTYGKYYELGFETKNNNNYVGYRLDFKTILDEGGSGFGSGKYRINFDLTSLSLYSEEYCLEQYTNFRADNTVRINYTWDRLIGDPNQKETRDFVGFNWTRQTRLSDAIFGYLNGDFESEGVRYNGGELNTVSKALSRKYKLELRKLPPEIQNVVIFDILMAKDISITDYNKENFTDYIEVFVEINGSLDPNYSDSRTESSMILEFKNKYDNDRSLYS